MSTIRKDHFISGKSLNIQGSVEKKLELLELEKLIIENDITCLQETWLTDSTDIEINGYKINRSDRGSHKKKNTGSGGVVFVYKQHLKRGLKNIKSKISDVLWLKLCKTYFGLENDIYLCNCYVPLSNSVLHKECIQGYFDVLKTEIAEFSVLGDIVLIGDLNARTGDLRENYSLIDENNDQDIVETNIFITARDNAVSNDLLSRVNEDITINPFGRKLMNLLNETHLIIVNGRKLGDYTGRKTCYTYNGSSTVDYCIVSSQLFCNILRLNVLYQDWFSDHCPITTALKINNIINPPKKTANKITDFR